MSAAQDVVAPGYSDDPSGVARRHGTVTEGRSTKVTTRRIRGAIGAAGLLPALLLLGSSGCERTNANDGLRGTGDSGVTNAAPAGDAQAQRGAVSDEIQALIDQTSGDVDNYLNGGGGNQTAATDSPVTNRIDWQDPGRTATARGNRGGDPKGSGGAGVLAHDAPTVAPASSGSPDGIPLIDDTTGAPSGLGGRDAYLRQLVVDMRRELWHESTGSDMPLRELILLSALTLVFPDETIDPDQIVDLTDDERVLLATMQDYFRSVGENLDGTETARSVLMDAVEALRTELNQRPQFHIKTAALCTSVRGFGDFDSIDTPRFHAHRGTEVIIYLEIDGFASNLEDDGKWKTATSQRLSIRSDRDDIVVWTEDWQTAVDRSQTPRSDYFTVQRMRLPSALSVGRYHLKLELRDEQTGAVAAESVEFVMTAQD